MPLALDPGSRDGVHLPASFQTCRRRLPTVAAPLSGAPALAPAPADCHRAPRLLRLDCGQDLATLAEDQPPGSRCPRRPPDQGVGRGIQPVVGGVALAVAVSDCRRLRLADERGVIANQANHLASTIALTRQCAKGAQRLR